MRRFTAADTLSSSADVNYDEVVVVNVVASRYAKATKLAIGSYSLQLEG